MDRPFAVPIPLWVLFFWGALLFGGGCASEAAPELLEVRELGAAVWEAGAPLEVRGAGFPEQRSGSVGFQGTVLAPGRQPRAVRLRLPALAESRSRVEVRVPQRRLAELTGGAEHATFRGRLSVEFPPTRGGGPVLRGESPELLLDVFLSRGAPVEVLPEASFSAFLGLETNELLEVTRVEVDSEAERAGLLVGDRLKTLDGVRLDGPHDFYPAAGARVSVLEFARDGHATLGTIVLDRSGYEPRLGRKMGEVVALLSALALAIVVAARPPRWIVWLFTRRVGRAGGARGAAPRAPTFLEHTVFFLVVVLAWFVLAVERRGASPLDLGAGMALGLSSFLAAAWIAAGRGGRSGRFRLGAALAGATGAIVLATPLTLALLLRSSELGSLTLVDFARSQGGAPTGWALFESPWNLCLGLAAFVALVPTPGRRSPLTAFAREGEPGRGLFEWLALVVFSVLWVVTFAGGAQGAEPGSFWGGVLLSVKCALFVQSISWLRARLGHPRPGEGGRLSLGVAGGLSLVGVLLYVGGLAARDVEAMGEFSALVAVTWALAGVLLLGLSALRALGHKGRVADPWI